MNRTEWLGCLTVATVAMWLVGNSATLLVLFWVTAAVFGTHYGISKAKAHTGA
jgi:hypothetical protein